jgi:hypothetical protein
MASSAVVGGVLLALIEGMGIMFMQMMAQPVLTAEDYEQQMQQQDCTAPPKPAGLFGSMMGGSKPQRQPTEKSLSAPPTTPSSMETDGTTTFSTESTASESSGTSDTSSSGGGSWCPFGGSK